MADLQNELEYPKQTEPRCRLPIKKVARYNTNNKIMSVDSNSSKKNNEYNDAANSNSDCNSTGSESSIDDTVERNCPPKYTSLLKDCSYNNAQCAEKYKKRQYLIPLFVLFLLVCSYFLFGALFCDVSQNNHNDRRERIETFRQSVENIQLKFKNQNFDTWSAFASQIEEVINESTQISVIILLGNDTNTVTCLAHLFGDISSKALSNDNYLTLNAKNIGNDHGVIIDKLKAEIQIDRVVIIEDLLSINSEAIKVLHNLCDKENPLVSKTVYIITIISSGYNGSHKDIFVEDCLTTKFSKVINLDILNPLITRIMDGPIISILPEPSMKEACLLF